MSNQYHYRGRLELPDSIADKYPDASHLLHYSNASIGELYIVADQFNSWLAGQWAYQPSSLQGFPDDHAIGNIGAAFNFMIMAQGEPYKPESHLPETPQAGIN